MRAGGILGAIVVVWLVIGVVAAFQRGYFNNGPTNCGSAATIALTVVAGPINYKEKPAASCPGVPQPAQ